MKWLPNFLSDTRGLVRKSEIFVRFVNFFFLTLKKLHAKKIHPRGEKQSPLFLGVKSGLSGYPYYYDVLES
jgi:hypothetical protein